MPNPDRVLRPDHHGLGPNRPALPSRAPGPARENGRQTPHRIAPANPARLTDHKMSERLGVSPGPDLPMPKPRMLKASRLKPKAPLAKLKPQPSQPMLSNPISHKLSLAKVEASRAGPINPLKVVRRLSPGRLRRLKPKPTIRRAYRAGSMRPRSPPPA